MCNKCFLHSTKQRIPEERAWNLLIETLASSFHREAVNCELVLRSADRACWQGESCIVMLWRHFQFYILACISSLVIQAWYFFQVGELVCDWTWAACPVSSQRRKQTNTEGLLRRDTSMRLLHQQWKTLTLRGRIENSTWIIRWFVGRDRLCCQS